MERLKLNLVPGGVLTVCHASQYDNGRTVRFDLYDGDSKVTLAGTETITAKLRKPSGAEVTLNVTNTSSDYVDVVTDSDTCDEAGVYLGELTVVSGSVIIGSANFVLLAEVDPYGQAQLVVRSASGSIVNFNTSVVEDLIECIAEFSASQASGTPTPSAPIPIVGVDKVNIARTGKNLLPSLSSAVTVNHITFSPLSDGAIDIDGTASGNASVDVGRNEGCFLQAGTYYVNITATPYTITVFGIVNGTVTTIKSGGGLFTLTKPTQIFVRVFIASGTTVNHLRLPLQLELGSTATDFEPYNGTTALINLGGTYYGGSVDKDGKITLMWQLLDISNQSFSLNQQGTNTYEVTTAIIGKKNGITNIKSNKFTQKSYADDGDYGIRGYTSSNVIAFRFPISEVSSPSDAKTWLINNGVQLIYELATPETEYASNTAEIPTIVGDNQVYADTGDVAVKYYAKSTD